ncbi:MAG: type II secretion system F family protein [Nakamurella sp.]
MNLAVIGAILGALAGLGLLLAIASSPPMRRLTLADRIAPYLADAPPASRLLAAPAPTGPASVLHRISLPLLKDVIRRLDRVVGGQASVRRRLGSLNSPLGVEDFRAEQVVWGTLGLLGGVGVGILALIFAQANPVGVAVLVLLCAVVGVLARDQWLTRQVRTRDAEILAEFPVVAEMLALAVTAGEGPSGAIERVTTLAHGPLVQQLAGILADTRSGTPFLEAIATVRDRTRLEPFARFLDGMAVAIERGTPLADVLRAQAADVRALSKRQLMEAGGRKEIGMMVPVVFLVLPITIIFALYPGLVAITTVAG